MTRALIPLLFLCACASDGKRVPMPAPVPAPARADAGFPAIVLEDGQVSAWLDHVDPPSRRLPWLPTAQAGLFASHELRRPLLLWAENAHPLRCACPSDLLGSRTVFDEPVLAPLLAEFVLAADERYAIEVGRDGASQWLRDAIRNGPGRGAVPSGLYALAPGSGVIAASRTLDLGDVTDALAEALEAWLERPETHGLPAGIAELAERRPGRRLAPGSVVLTVVGRPLTAEDPAAPRHVDVEQDELWIDAAEARALIPDPPRPGSRVAHDVLARRLARLYLIDPQDPEPFAPDEVREATLEARVVAADGARLRLQIAGTTACERRSDGAAVAARVLGHAEYDLEEQRFTAWNVVAKGFLRKDRAAPHVHPVAWALRRSAPWRAGRVEPRHLDLYESADLALQ